MPKTQLERVLERQRRELIKLDNEGAAEMVAAWKDLNRYLQDQLDQLLKAIAANPRALNRATLRRFGRYQQLLADVERASLRFAEQATLTIKDSQVRALSLVDSHTREATFEALGGRYAPEIAIASVQGQFGRLPAGAYMRLVGNASDGNPLGALLRKIAPKAKDEAANVLTRGIAQGHNPRQIAKAFKLQTGVTYTRAETISRTEVIRAYREAALETYRSSPVVTEWVWVATLDTRTCFACAQMSGTIHSMSEMLDGHPRCRCSMAPRTKSWADLGYKDLKDTRPQIPLGSDWFNGLAESAQRAMLGPSKFDALKSGQIKPQDLIQRPRNRTWGTMRREASLKEALVAAKR